MDSKSTQQKRILDLLKSRGSRGVTSYERIELRILQLPTRIHELKRQGYHIISERIKGSKEVRYVLKDNSFNKEGQGNLDLDVRNFIY